MKDLDSISDLMAKRIDVALIAAHKELKPIPFDRIAAAGMERAQELVEGKSEQAAKTIRLKLALLSVAAEYNAAAEAYGAAVFAEVLAELEARLKP